MALLCLLLRLFLNDWLNLLSDFFLGTFKFYFLGDIVGWQFEMGCLLHGLKQLGYQSSIPLFLFGLHFRLRHAGLFGWWLNLPSLVGLSLNRVSLIMLFLSRLILNFHTARLFIFILSSRFNICLLLSRLLLNIQRYFISGILLSAVFLIGYGHTITR